MRGAAFAAVFALAGCAGQLSPPSQPTPTSINAAIADMAQITADPATVWQVGDYEVRAACHAYLNAAAAKAAQATQLGVAAGAVGVGLSAVNPIAGIASSLFQTFLSAYQAAGTLPYTRETSTIVFKALDDYSAQVNAALPTSVPDAMSYVDDEWDDCTPDGYDRLVSAAISTASIGGGGGMIHALQDELPLPRRPITTVNGKPI